MEPNKYIWQFEEMPTKQIKVTLTKIPDRPLSLLFSQPHNFLAP